MARAKRGAAARVNPAGLFGCAGILVAAGAFVDPVGDECVLVLDEKVGEPDYGLRTYLLLVKILGGGAVLMAVAGLALWIRR